MAEFEEESFEVSNEEKLQIAQHYLLSSPPGQFTDVLSDVRKIVSDEILTDAVVAGVARSSNTKNGNIVTAPSGGKVALHAAGEIDPTHYFDPINGTSFALNHVTLTTTEAEAENKQDASLEPIRAALQNSVGTYAKSAYISENSAASVYARDGTLTVVVSGEKSNLKNFWSGKWTSVWTIQIENDQQAVIKGDIKIHVHYFEDGNLQMQTHKPVAATTISFASELELSNKVTELIKNQESILQTGLEEMYTNMNAETFKSMRRVMPITRTKMDWNVNSVRMVRQVRK